MSWRKLESILQTVDGVLLSSAHNLRYFTNFCGGEGIALITAKERFLFVDSRYTVSAQQEAREFTVVEFAGGMRNRTIAEAMTGIHSLAYEDAFLTVAEFESLKSIKPTIVWEGASQSLERLRMIKSEEEITLLSQAEQIGVAAFQAVLPQIKPGMSEMELAAELEYQMRKCGAEGTSFETIAISGVKTSMPHGRPSNKLIEVGDFVTMDFGCVYQGYCSDMTRTVAVGKVTKEQTKIYQTVQQAQQAGLDAIRSGIPGKDADYAARKVIEEAGFGEYFGHSLGHGVGLLVHELPNLSPRSEITLECGMVVTCEPGIYIPNVGGVRIEDMVYVTEDGNRNLTSLTKELLII